MRRSLTFVLALLCLAATAITAADKKADQKRQKWLKQYLKQYPYLDTLGPINTFESEFTWPEGFHRLDPKKLTPFQNWVSNIPMWDDGKSVYAINTGTVLKREKISRSIRYPWRTAQFRDCIIPLQLLADYKYWTNRPQDLAYVTKVGDTVTYGKFLENEISYTPRFRIKYTPTEKREPSEKEFIAYFDLCAFNSDYASLEKQCSPVTDFDFRPGDIYLGRDTVGRSGKVFVILVVATDGKQDYRYIVGAGCNEPCDFYVPLFHDNRSDPWLTLDELKALVTGYPVIGFHRPRVPGKR